jgi:hypothetical protein
MRTVEGCGYVYGIAPYPMNGKVKTAPSNSLRKQKEVTIDDDDD